jgi:hypothetical protein
LRRELPVAVCRTFAAILASVAVDQGRLRVRGRSRVRRRALERHAGNDPRLPSKFRRPVGRCGLSVQSLHVSGIDRGLDGELHTP